MIIIGIVFFLWYLTGGLEVWSDAIISDSVFNSIEDALLHESELTDIIDYIDWDYIIEEPVIFTEATWDSDNSSDLDINIDKKEAKSIEDPNW
jgi:hypothetical protein